MPVAKTTRGILPTATHVHDPAFRVTQSDIPRHT
jgi:hypothetical protein